VPDAAGSARADARRGDRLHQLSGHAARAPMMASMRRGPQRGRAISGNGVMCQGDPDASRLLEADRSLPHQVEVDAASAQFGEIPPHHAEFGIELHPHRHHPIAAH